MKYYAGHWQERYTNESGLYPGLKDLPGQCKRKGNLRHEIFKDREIWEFREGQAIVYPYVCLSPGYLPLDVPKAPPTKHI